jgi:hypothetical protein
MSMSVAVAQLRAFVDDWSALDALADEWMQRKPLLLDARRIMTERPASQHIPQRVCGPKWYMRQTDGISIFDATEAA